MKTKCRSGRRHVATSPCALLVLILLVLTSSSSAVPRSSAYSSNPFRRDAELPPRTPLLPSFRPVMARAGKSPCAFAPVAFLDTPDTADRDAVTHLARGDTRVAALPGAATAGVDAVAGLTWAHSRVAVLLGAATTGLHGVAGLARAHPKVAALLIASAKGGAADALAQRSGGGGGGGRYWRQAVR